MIYINRSIPLSNVSRDAWRNAGAIILSRSPVKSKRQLDKGKEDDIIINLGIGPLHLWGMTTYNEHESVRSVITPAALRETLGNLIPPWPNVGEEAWWKGPGYGGHNKYRGVNTATGHLEHLMTKSWDVQKHIEGIEYRVVTVGNVVVQAHRKDNRTEIDDSLMFLWNWVGVKGVSNNGIIPLVKKAVELIPNGDFSMFGWDIIVSEGRPYIIEGNSSPGVNNTTAKRIVGQIVRNHEIS